MTSKVRHAVGVEATSPNSDGWSRSTARSEMASPPAAIIVATSTSTWPRSWPRRRCLVGAIATDSASVNPSSSARSDNKRAPAWPTTFSPSALTFSLGRLGLRFTSEVPSCSGQLRPRQPQFPLPGGRFRGRGPSHPPNYRKVRVNGCETAPAVPPPDAAGSAWDAQFALFGLARAFLESGAYVLGTRWRLPDVSGLGFARHFYRMLLNERAPFGRAISEARRTLLAEDPEDISWASYIYWGDPRVYFRRARTTSVVLPPGAVRAMPATGEVTAADARALA